MLKGIIYLDHAATTPVHPLVRREMSSWFTDFYGNPSTLYSIGTKSKEAIEEARQKVAGLIGARTDEIYFTSGGTESDNWALRGVLYANEEKGRHLITTSVEHHAVLDTAQWLQKQGYEVSLLPVDSYGLVDIEALKKTIRDDTVLVSVMHANNEVGTIQPIKEIAKIVKEKGIYFHTDAVQTVGNIPVNVDELGCDLLSISAHKLYGPKGVGALYIRKGTRIEKFMIGGGQESNKRAGTHNVPGIVGLGKACEIARIEMPSEAQSVRRLRDRLRDGILERVSDIMLTGHPEHRLPNNLSICVEGVEGESILLCLDMNRICVSSGSACTTGSLEPSHVLLAMGIPAEVSHGSVRFTLGRENTDEQISYVLDVFPVVIKRLRSMSPTYKKS